MTVMGDGVMRRAIFPNKQCPMEHKKRHRATQPVPKNRKEANRGSITGTCRRRLAIVRGGKRTIRRTSFESGGLSR